jgi:hypothetical protein
MLQVFQAIGVESGRVVNEGVVRVVGRVVNERVILRYSVQAERCRNGYSKLRQDVVDRDRGSWGCLSLANR